MEQRYRKLTRVLYGDATLQAFVAGELTGEPYEVALARLLAEADCTPGRSTWRAINLEEKLPYQYYQ